MIARINRVPAEAGRAPSAPDRPRVMYDKARCDEDPFPDPSLLGSIDADQHEDIRTAADEMIETPIVNGLPAAARGTLIQIVQENLNISRTTLSSRPSAKVAPLKISLTPDARPVCVRLRKYSQEQRQFLDNFVTDLIQAGMAYPNPSSPWASAPLIVLKPGAAHFRFTVDLRPINKYTVKHQ